jgi:DNA-binding MarR family transcriptional regulator
VTRQPLDTVVQELRDRTTLWRDFLLAHRILVEKMADQMQRDHGLPLESFDVLIHLADVPSMRLRQAQLRDRLLLSESGVSRLLARMGRAGLIARTPSDDDRRGIDIALTERGQEALLAATRSHLAMVDQLFNRRLGDDDAAALARILGGLLKPDEAEEAHS